MRLRLFLQVIVGACMGSLGLPGIICVQVVHASSQGLSAQPGFTRADLDALWARRQAAMAQGRTADAQAALLEVLAAKQRAGWPDLFAHGDALAFESQAAAAAGDPAHAVHLARAAHELAPHRLAPLLALTAAHWQQKSWHKTLESLWAAAKLVVAEPPFRLARLSAYGLWLLFGLSVAFVGFVAACLYRYAGLLWHDVGHLLPRRLAPVTQAALLMTVVLLPALLRLGPLSWALIWLCMMAPYLRRRERLAATAAMIGVVILIAAMPWVGRAILYPGSAAEAAYLVTRDLGADAEATRLAASLKPTPLDCYSLGLRARWQGNLADSRRWLERAIGNDVAGPNVYISLGNARWLQQAPNEAMAAYKMALERDPKNIYALFNLSQARFALVTEPQDDARRLANTIDYRLVARLAEHAKKTGIPVVEPPMPGELLHRPVHVSADYLAALAQLFRPLGGPVPRQVHGVALALLCGYLLWLNKPQALRRRTTDCRRCGDAICYRCVRGPAGRTHCAICAKITGPTVDADRQARIKKEIASHRFFARRLATQRRLAWALPGFGQLLKGEADWGLCILTLFCVCMLGVATAFGYIIALAPVYSGFGRLFGLFHAALAVILYSVALVYGQKEEG